MALNCERPSENCPTKMRTRWDSRSYGKVEFIVKLHNIKIHECIFTFIFGVPTYNSIFAKIDNKFLKCCHSNSISMLNLFAFLNIFYLSNHQAASNKHM